MTQPILQRVDVGGLELAVATAGAGPAILFVHGIPHTWFVWRHAMVGLAERYRVIAPDLRGLGDTARAHGGYDVATIAGDLEGVLDALGVMDAVIVAIDLGVQAAVMLALQAPARVRKLVVMEGLVGALPGAERFLVRGAPWWFGFHGVADLPETLIEGREAAYLDFFLTNGTFERRGIAPEARAAFLHAYRGRESIRCMCDHYRAMPVSGRQIAEAVATRKLAMPTLAISGGVVGDAVAGQLAAISTDLHTTAIANTAHIVPEDQPAALLAELERFLAR